jgi:hypothetical protein
MLFSVFTLDNPDAIDKRKTVHSDHVAHLKSESIRCDHYGRWTVGVGRWRHLNRQPDDSGSI